MKKYSYEGLLSLHCHGEASNVLFLSSLVEPLAEELSFMKQKTVTVRFWTSSRQPESAEAMKEGFIKHLCGLGKTDFGHAYSECTGYLWTDEEINVGATIFFLNSSPMSGSGFSLRSKSMLDSL